MLTIICVIGMGAACVSLAWYEHKSKLGEAVERAVLIERRRVSSYLRDQSMMAESISKCQFLSAIGREQEAYASAVLSETADEISECAHHKVRP